MGSTYTVSELIFSMYRSPFPAPSILLIYSLTTGAVAFQPVRAVQQFLAEYFITGLLGGHIGIMLAPRARGLWFDPPTNLKYFYYYMSNP